MRYATLLLLALTACGEREVSDGGAFGAGHGPLSSPTPTLPVSTPTLEPTPALTAIVEPLPPPQEVLAAVTYPEGSLEDAFPEAPVEWREYVCALWGDGCYRALRISRCELGGIWQPSVVNWASGVKGAWQIHPIHEWRFVRRGWAWEDAADPYRNTDIAFEIWSEQDWSPWACARWN